MLTPEYFNFSEIAVRVSLGHDGKPRWVIRDILQALNYKVTSGVTKFVGHVPREWKTSEWFETPGGPQKLGTFTEEGLYFFLNHSKKPLANPFQIWVNGSVIPSIRQTGSYTVPTAAPVQSPLSTAQMFLQAAQVLAEQEQKLVEIQAMQTKFELRLQTLEKKEVFPDPVLPSPTVGVLGVTTRTNLTLVVKGYCKEHSYEYEAAYNRLYAEFLHRYGIDLKLRAENRGCKPLDIAEEMGRIEDLYALAFALFGGNSAKPKPLVAGGGQAHPLLFEDL